MKSKILLYYFLAVIAIGFLMYEYFFTGIEYGMMNHHYGYYNYHSRNLGLLNTGFAFISYIVLILCAILILKEKTIASNTALEILNDRFSKGEISIEEYQTISEILKGNRWEYDAFMGINNFYFILFTVKWEIRYWSF